MTVNCLNIGIDFKPDGTYNGVVVGYGSAQASRHFAGDFRKDYKQAIAEAKLIRHGRIICLGNSLLLYSRVMNEGGPKRNISENKPPVRYNGSKKKEPKEILPELNWEIF